MQSILRLLGIIFIVIGIVTLTYQGITYTTRENVAKIGDFEITATSQKTVYVPPILGGLCFVAGIVLVVFGRGNKS